MPTDRHAEATRLLAAGFKLCALHYRSKRPVGDAWQRQHVATIDPAAGGYGVLLATNGLCSIDPDNVQPAREGFARCGFELEALMQAGVRTTSTRPGSGGRSTFRAPPGLRRVVFASKLHGTILELRAGNANLQDALPGTVYEGADGSGPYRQAYAGTRKLDEAPELPANVLTWWQRMNGDVAFLREQQALFAGPDAVLAVSAAAGPLAHASPYRLTFNETHDVPGILERHGYATTDGERWAPSTATGAPSVRAIPGRDGLWQSDHASDPLHGTFDAWTAHVVLDHDGDQSAAEQPLAAAREAAAAADFDVIPPTTHAHDLFDGVTLRDEEVSAMTQPVFLIQNMIVGGHLAAFAAPGNGGKTTLFLHLTAQMCAAGCDVIYVNADGSPGDLIRQHAHSKKHGYRVVAPDARVGKSAHDVVKIIEQLARGDAPLGRMVLIIDTLKKFVDVINKTKAKEFYRTLRALTVRGATVCLLCHTNKYAGADGQQIFEGTGDLRSDVDELIYLDAVKDDDAGTLTITTRPDKVRAALEKRSFIVHLDDDRRVEEVDRVLPMRSRETRMLERLFREAIEAGESSQAGIVRRAQESTTVGLNRIRAALQQLSTGEGAPIKSERTGRGTDLRYSINEAADALC